MQLPDWFPSHATMIRRRQAKATADAQLSVGRWILNVVAAVVALLLFAFVLSALGCGVTHVDVQPVGGDEVESTANPPATASEPATQDEPPLRQASPPPSAAWLAARTVLRLLRDVARGETTFEQMQDYYRDIMRGEYVASVDCDGVNARREAGGDVSNRGAPDPPATQRGAEAQGVVNRSEDGFAGLDEVTGGE